ncbi:MAG: hemolysin family protein [Bacteroidota bacterium]|nr:hemolysin family protein [Bacteroidota bacterium]
MDYYAYEIIFIILSIFLAGYLSAAEMAIASFGAQKIDELKEKGDKIAKSFESIQKISDSFFGTIQILSTIFSASAIILNYHLIYTISKTTFAGVVSPEWLAIITFVISLVIILPLLIVFTVLIPKGMGFKYADQIGRSSVKIILLFAKILNIPVKVLNSASNFLLKPFKEKTNFTQTRFSEDEIRIIISEGVKSGALNETEQEIIENIFEFNDLKANEVICPRTEMVAIDIEESIEEITSVIFNTPYTILPVYEGSLDNIIGVLRVKEYLKEIHVSKEIKIKELIKPAYFIPEYKLISEVLREMRVNKERMAIVMDEYGGTEGFITMEDIIGEIVGDITSIDSSDTQDIIKTKEGAFLVLGSVSIDDFNSAFNYDLPVSDEYNTVAGFVADFTGKIMNEGEQFAYKRLQFRLIKKERQKMVQFKIHSEEFEFDWAAE